MNRTFNIQVQRADNGFIAIAQSDVSGVKSKKHVATSEADVIAAVKEFADHMFDPAPPKEPEQKPSTEEKPNG